MDKVNLKTYFCVYISHVNVWIDAVNPLQKQIKTKKNPTNIVGISDR